MKVKIGWLFILFLFMQGSAFCAEEAIVGLKEGIYAKMNTSKGEIIFELFYEKTPLTVTNFIGLAEGILTTTKGKPFYNNLKFHRVIKNYITQGGDPEGSGRGTPGYAFFDEFSESLKHDKTGVVSMANSGLNTNGSQFFVTHKPTPWLDGLHSIFGQVVKGMDIFKKIEKGDIIKNIEILRIGGKAKSFEVSQQTFDKLYLIRKDDIAKKKEEAILKFNNFVKQKWPDYSKTESGLFFFVEKEGSGPFPEQGKTLSVHYTGTFLDGKKIDDFTERGKPYSFVLGKGKVIRGWEEALSTMKKGEKRVLIIPPDLAYGEIGIPPIIPPHSPLIFAIELIDVTDGKDEMDH